MTSEDRRTTGATRPSRFPDWARARLVRPRRQCLPVARPAASRTSGSASGTSFAGRRSVAPIARLILLNGPPASGKSTLARRFADEHPLTLCLDVDVVRGLLGDWVSRPQEAGLLARQMATEMARVALSSDRQVIVPQFLAKADFIVELETLADATGAAFVELALTARIDDVVAWFSVRSADPETPAHRDAQELLDRSGGVEELRPLLGPWQRLVDSRPGVRRLTARRGDIDSSYEDLEHALLEPPHIEGGQHSSAPG